MHFRIRSELLFFFLMGFLLQNSASAIGNAENFGASACISIGGPLREDMKRGLSAPGWSRDSMRLVRELLGRLGASRTGQCDSIDFFRKISTEVNQLVSYGHEVDLRVFGAPDYWQSAGETLNVKVKTTGERVGDCEDFALLKYWIAREAGCSPHKMWIAVLRSTPDFHAALFVEVAGEIFVLDNNESENGKKYLASRYGREKSLLFLVNESFRKWVCPVAESN